MFFCFHFFWLLYLELDFTGSLPEATLFCLTCNLVLMLDLIYVIYSGSSLCGGLQMVTQSI